MLLQSHESEIRFLPALPREWPEGEVKGLCARGAIEVDMSWREGRLLAIELRPKTNGVRRLQAATGQQIRSVSAGGKPVAIKRLSDAAVEVLLNAGQSYQARCS
jgi:alpha-L-fucosidase 2